MASTLSDLLQSLRSDAEGKVEGDLSPALMKALDTYSRSYSATMTSLQKSYERGLTGLEKKLGEMAAAYEASAVSNSEDARALIRELLTSQKKANQQQTDLNAQWRELAESYFPQISKEQLSNEIAKRREQEKRMDLLKQELGISARRASSVKTEMQLLDSFKSFGKDPVVGSLVEAVKGKIQGGFDERAKAFDDLSKQRDANIAAFQKSAMDMYAGMAKGKSFESATFEKAPTKEDPATKALDNSAFFLKGIEMHLKNISMYMGQITEPPVAAVRGETPVEDVPVANAGTPAPTQDNTPPVAQKLSEKAADAAIDRMMASQPELNTGVAPVAKNVATGALGGKGGFLNLGGLGSALTSTISKGLSSLGNVLFKALGPLGWLASIGQSIDGVLPIFSSTFGALYDVLRMAGPFLASLVLDSVTNLLSLGNMIISAIDGVHEGISQAFHGDYRSVRTRAEESGTLGLERAKALDAVMRRDQSIGDARGGFTAFNPLAGVGGVRIGRAAVPTRNELPLTTPSEERAMAETATPAPAPAPQDQSALVAALQRITAPQNPGTTAIMPSSPYLQTFAV